MRQITEKGLESKLVYAVEAMGGLCVKMLTTYSHIGMPDRMCLMANGKMAFAEIKTPGQKPRKNQVFAHDKLRGMGYKVVVIDSLESLHHFLAYLFNLSEE